MSMLGGVLELAPVGDGVQRAHRLYHLNILCAGSDRKTSDRAPDHELGAFAMRVGRDRGSANDRPTTARERHRRLTSGDDDETVPLEVAAARQPTVLDDENTCALETAVERDVAADEDDTRTLTRAERCRARPSASVGEGRRRGRLRSAAGADERTRARAFHHGR